MSAWRQIWRFLWPALQLSVAAVIAVAAVLSIREVWAARGASGLLPLVLVLPILFVQLLVVGTAWGLLFKGVVPQAVPRPVLVRSFVYGWMCRYVPGAPAGPVGKFVACRRAGYSIAAISSALMYENILQMGAGALVPALTFGFIASEWEIASWVTPLVVVGSISATGIALLPGVTPFLFRLLSRTLGVGDAAVVRVPFRRELIAPGLLLLAGATLGGVAFHLAAVSVAGWPADQVGVTLFVFSLAAFTGWVVPFAPSGAGVREALIVSLLGPLVGANEALQAAIVARSANVVADVLLAAAYLLVLSLRRFQGSGLVGALNNRA